MRLDPDCAAAQSLPMPAGPLQPGQLLARGVSRHLRQHDFASITEFTPARGLRVDVMAIGPKGEIWIIECKSSRADYATDQKWQGYLEWCDRFFWAVGDDFPTEILPAGTGLIIADAYDGEIQRMPDPTPLAGARRGALTRRIARVAASRLASMVDPGPASMPLD
jgi:hypothetical protein